MKRVVVAGATGLVGSALIDRLSETHAVHALARSAPRSRDRVAWHQADLAGPPAAWSLPPAWDTTIYLAQSRRYRQFPDGAADVTAVNVQAVVSMLNLSIRGGASRFLLASTANVYAASAAALDESARVEPDSFYARTRRAAELLAEPFAEHLDVMVLRMFTVYGPGQGGDTLIASLVDRIAAGRAIQVQGSRGLLLSPVYLDDAVDAFVRLADRPGSSRGFRIVNVAGGEAVGIEELASMIGAAVGRPPVIEHVAGPEPGGWIGNAALLRSLTGWSPRTTLKQGLQQIVLARAR